MGAWLNRNIIFISLSAMFADLGYQTIIAGFPILLVLYFGASPTLFGLASALAFGIGSFFGYLGGRVGDRYGNRKIAIIGNLLIPLLSLIGLAVSPVMAIALYCGGWWARNFRTPSRRKLLSDSAGKSSKTKAFGFLHMLDIGGGMLSIIALLILLGRGLNLKTIFLITALPILLSTMFLLFVKPSKSKRKKNGGNVNVLAKGNANAYKGVIIATALYGFSSYSLGFPILTIAKSSTSILGIVSYLIYMGVSAFTGYLIGLNAKSIIKVLSFYGYIISAVGSLLLGISYALNLGLFPMYISVAVLGFGFGVIETLEPTVVSIASNTSNSMGFLTASRSLGLFFGNLIMGILYVINPFDSYAYAAVVSIIAGIIICIAGRNFRIK
ncbi:MAG: MFS transporter [Candidatus Marsarchaeota archaeon]|nr:MFS transporter [Candidatus Marsarchaeota archaeon]